MATVINRVTRQILRSVNTPNFSPTDWIINPSLPSCDEKYFKIIDDSVVEMSEQEKIQVDESEASYEYVLGEGYLDVSGIKLKSTQDAQLKFTQMLTLVQTALLVGAIDQNTNQVIYDFNDNLINIKTSDYLGLMIRYGTYIQNIFYQFANR